MNTGKQPFSTIPSDNPQRKLVNVNPGNDSKIPHIGVVGDTYTILLRGTDTNGHFCLIDMYVFPGSGPPPHRHDFEETFTMLEGQLDFIFRGEKLVVQTGETINVPANAPHQFTNSSLQPARMLCICSPAGQDEFFLEVGVPVPTRTSRPSKLSEEEQLAFREKVAALVSKYKTEILQHT